MNKLMLSQRDILLKEAHVQSLINRLAPGTPPYNRNRSHNPIAYHKYTDGAAYTFYIMEYIIADGYLWFW